MNLHPIEKSIIRTLEGRMSIEELSQKSGLKIDQVRRGISGLIFRKLVREYPTKRVDYSLSTLGKSYLQKSLPEIRLLEDSLSRISLKAATSKYDKNEFNASFGFLKKNELISVNKGDIEITPKGKEFLDKKEDQNAILALSKGEKIKVNQELVKRGIIEAKESVDKVYELSSDATQIDSSEDDEIQLLTSEMIKNDSWKDKSFRKYDVSLLTEKHDVGRRHPVSEVVNSLRKIFLEMGFKEMIGPWVDTAFWCMDSMWIPQDHPARDVQDTFFIGKKGDLPKGDLVKKVKSVQETGGNTGSLGHRISWNPETAKELILRTHTTAETFRKFGVDNVKEGKYFYVGEVFRNEVTDSTHLPEFLQAEGFIIGDNLTLADLMGFVKEFYAKLGIHKIRFKPTYNPYTEPSMEAHYYDERLKKWYALINSGIFRPESLAPYGINKSVIAWGMGASPRLVNIIYNKTRLKDLVGPEVDIEWLKKHKVHLVM